MNYSLELNKQEIGSHIVFTTIMLDSFKVNIVERYSMKMVRNPKLCEVLFKVRTLDNQILEKKDGNVNTYIRGDGFIKYQNFTNVLSSHLYKKKMINRIEAEQDFVYFILSLVILNYEFK